MNHLRHLDISGCTISPQGMKSLPNIRDLHSLNISDCRVVPMLAPQTVKLLGVKNCGFLDYMSRDTLQARGVEVVEHSTFQARVISILNH
jgi:hypothetical protein